MKSTIHISAEALRGNLRALQETAGPAFDLFCVLKANAYGHGIGVCAPVLVEAGARWLGVADLEEALCLRKALDRNGMAHRPVHLVTMCGFEPGDAPGLIRHGCTPVVWTPEHIHALEHAAAAAGQSVPVHLEIDTGMARQGAAPGEPLRTVLDALERSPHVELEGVFSHLSSSEVAGSRQTVDQLPRLHKALEQITAAKIRPKYVHLGNSSAVDEGSTLPWVRGLARDGSETTPLLRPGLALYGYTLPLQSEIGLPGVSNTGLAALASETQLASSPLQRLSPRLRPVATWTTRILDLRDLQQGDTVGYGATFRASAPRRVALLPVGYADGFRRSASSGVGNGWVTLNGSPAPVLGRVSMNLTVVDVSGHNPPPCVGDEAVLLGPGVTAHDHAGWADTIPYEILCGMRGHHRLT